MRHSPSPRSRNWNSERLASRKARWTPAYSKVCHWASARLSLAPRGGQGVAALDVDELEARAETVGPGGPRVAVAVGHLVDAGAFGGLQADRLAAVAEGALARAEENGAPDAVARAETRRVLGDDDVGFGADAGFRREREAEAAHRAPGQIHGLGAPVVDLEIFVAVVLGDGVVHDLADDEIGHGQRLVGGAGRGSAAGSDGPGAVGNAAGRRAGDQAARAHGVDDACAAGEREGAFQVRRREGEVGSEGLGGKRQEAVGIQDDAVGNTVLPQDREVVGDEPAAQGKRFPGGIEKLDEAAGTAGDFVDLHRGKRRARHAARSRPEAVGRSRRAAHGGALRPTGGVPGIEERIAQRQRVPGAVGAHGPGIAVVVPDGARRSARRVDQPERAALVAQAALEPERRAREPVRFLKLRRGPRHQQVLAGEQHGSRGEGEVDLALDPPTAQIGARRLGIVELDELEGLLGIGGVIHDLGDDDARLRAERRREEREDREQGVSPAQCLHSAIRTGDHR